MSVVYVAQKPTKNKKGWLPDLTIAMSYGDLDYVFTEDHNMLLHAQSLAQRADNFLQEFNIDEDYLLFAPNSHPLALVYCINSLKNLDLPYFNFLNWRNDKYKYYPERVCLDSNNFEIF